ncbi:MAG: ATP-binding protein [Nitrospirota bacterium]
MSGKDTSELLEENAVLKTIQGELEQRVKDLTAKLTNANNELEAFIYSAAHDLRAPLRGIDNLSKIIIDDYGTVLDTKGVEYFHLLCARVQKMGQIIDDLLSLSQVTRTTLSYDTVSLSDLALELVAELQKEYQGCVVKVVIADGLSVQGDQNLLRVLLANLLDNAFKFSSKKEQPCIEVGLRQEGTEAVFFVSDNGVGFPMKYSEKVFTAFERLHSENEFSGDGIGLTTAQRIVQRHGGRIWVEAEDGRGATFFWTLSK